MRSLLGKVILVVDFVSFCTLNISCHSLLTCRILVCSVSAKRSSVNQMGFPLNVICCLSFCMTLFISLWLCWVFIAQQTFSGCGQQGLLFVEVHGLLIAVASLAAQHRLQAHRPNPPLMCGTALLA